MVEANQPNKDKQEEKFHEATEQQTARESAPEEQASQPEQAGNAASAPAAELPSIDELKKEVERLEQELEQFKDRALRAQAELENYRKRVARERELERQYAEINLIRDLLPVLDDLWRAIAAAEAAGENANQSLRDGVRMVAEKFEQVLSQHHCRRIEAVGKPFDPNVHEAIAHVPSGEHPPNTVIEEARVGFMLHDRVVRPSQVVVSAPAEQAATDTTEAQSEQLPDDECA